MKVWLKGHRRTVEVLVAFKSAHFCFSLLKKFGNIFSWRAQQTFPTLRKCFLLNDNVKTSKRQYFLQALCFLL